MTDDEITVRVPLASLPTRETGKLPSVDPVMSLLEAYGREMALCLARAQRDIEEKTAQVQALLSENAELRRTLHIVRGGR